MRSIGAIAERSRASAPRLIVFTDTMVAAEPLLEQRIGRLVALGRPGGIVVVLRDKELPARKRLALGERLRKVVSAAGQELAVADRIDLGVLLGATGIHLGESSISVADARALLPAGTWVSRACHDPSRLDVDADAVILSPVVAPRKGRGALGFAPLEAARKRLDRVVRGPPPLLYALGGIDERSAAECLAHGADGVVVVSAALDGRDPRALLDALGITIVTKPGSAGT